MKYKLPTFPDHIRSGFKRMCLEIPVDQIPALRMELFNYMGEVEKKHSLSHVVDLKLARTIAQICCTLLDKYEEFSKKNRCLTIAAVKYFLSDGDGISDFDFASGLLDDAQVINHVLESVDIENLFINIEVHRS
ncbi:MAG: hypothetical protein SGJ02_08585 [bacterium]|nr:hypothetical protein [bacterium]